MARRNSTAFIQMALFIFLWFSIAYSQLNQIRFEHLTPKDGLSHMVVFDILEDRHGFIWFATQVTVDRYDGYTFKSYRNKPSDPNSISGLIPTALLQDQKGHIWIATTDGVNRLEPATQKIKRFKPDGMEGLNIWCMSQDPTGALWLGTMGQGLYRFDPASEKFIHFANEPENPNSLSHNIVRALAVDQNGALWIGTLNGLDRVNLKRVNASTSLTDIRTQIVFAHYRHNPGDLSSLSHDAIESLYVDRQGALWVGTAGGGLNRLSHWEKPPAPGATEMSNSLPQRRPVFKRFQHDPNDPNSISANYITTILQDHEGLYWIGTASRGVNVFDPDNNTFYRYEMQAEDPNSLTDNMINKIYEDRAGNIWIATQNGGVNRYSRHQKQFNHLLKKAELPEGLESNNVNAVIEDENGDLWVSFINYGLAKYDRKRKKIVDVDYLLNPSGSSLRMPAPGLCRHASGVFWLGTWGDGLRKFDPVTRKITFYRYDPSDSNSLSDNRIIAVYPRSDGTIWITTQSGGLNEFNPETETFTRYMHDPNDSTSISTNLTHNLFEDRDGTLWIGTVGGGLNQLIELPATKDTPTTTKRSLPVRQFIRYQHDPKDPASLAHNTVCSVIQDSRGHLWVGTGNGLDKLDKETGTFQHFSEENGYPFGFVTHILEDLQGNLWVVTTKALVKFNEQGLDATGQQFYLYDFTKELGVNLLPILPSATWRGQSGEIFLAGYEGIIAFYPDQIQNNPHVPPVKITEFYVFDRPVRLDSSITEKKVIILPYKDNVFSLEFAALNYIQPHKNQYAYKFEGFDKDWVYSGNRRRATYTNIAPGSYTFRVKASNNDGVWNEEGAWVRIIITPPWWRSGWAYVSYVLLLGLLLYGIRRFELNRIHLRNELRRRAFEARKLQELDEMKSRFFANISHEFRTPLTLILGPLETLLSRNEEAETQQALDMMRRNARRLQQLINQLLDLSKLQSGRIELRAQQVNVVPFVRTLLMGFASLAERKGIQLSFHAEKQDIRMYADRDKLEKIVSNLISNALKFTAEGGEVKVTVKSGESTRQSSESRGDPPSPPENSLLITVQDSGPGIALEHLDKIFDRFYQVDDSGTRHQEGTGIGLALAKELVELHHGEIWVESEPDKGASFFVRLPLGRAHFKPHEIVEPESPSDEPGAVISETTLQQPDQGRTANRANQEAPLLLIVEDNTDVRSYLCGHLQKHYRIVEAENGLQGFERAVAEIPDLVVSDVMMPELSGFALCEKLKTDPRTSHTPVILLTARASGESKIVGLETGADDYITKPFDVKELQVRVKNLIEQRRQLRERFQREFILQPREVEVMSADEKFLRRAVEVVEGHIADSEFSVARLVNLIGMSTMQLHRKLKALTGQSATEFIRAVRLKRAAYLLERGSGNVAEIAYEVGFNNPSYFAARFREQYGMSPSEYRAYYAKAKYR